MDLWPVVITYSMLMVYFMGRYVYEYPEAHVIYDLNRFGTEAVRIPYL